MDRRKDCENHMLQLIISGCNGHMGRVVSSLCEADPDLAVAAGFDLLGTADREFPVFSSPAEFSGEADVVVDFSSTAALTPLLAFCTARRLPLVLCTTGFSETQLVEIESAATAIPIFRSANMSLGVSVLQALVKKAAAVLEGYDIEIVERHHNRKVDAPSGTALMLADAAASARLQPSEYIYDRHSVRQPRGCDEIGISSVRGGTIVGEHEVIFAGRDEVIELRHSAQSREIFASGALRAARFLAAPGQRPGLYSMSDLVASVAE